MRGLKYNDISNNYSLWTSHPSRVRGLKFTDLTNRDVRKRSHPSRVRGLKSDERYSYIPELIVAPLAGAWIEIFNSSVYNILNSLVAPLAGAWIEIAICKNNFSSNTCRTPRGCVD